MLSDFEFNILFSYYNIMNIKILITFFKGEQKLV